MDNDRQKAIEEIANRPELKDRAFRYEIAEHVLSKYLEKVDDHTLNGSSDIKPKGFF